MVENSAAVVFHGGLDVLRKARCIYNELLRRPALKFGITAEGMVQIVDVGL